MNRLRFFASSALFLMLISCGGGGGSNSGSQNPGGNNTGGQVVITPTLQGTYYAVSTTDPDFTCSSTTQSQTKGLLNTQLSSNGIPVAVTNAPIFDLNTNREVLWWDTANPNVTVDVSAASSTLPIAIQNFFPTGQSTDTVKMRTAHWKGTLAATTNSFTFTVSSDDDSWVFLDGQLVIDSGGVKGGAVVPLTQKVPVAVGNHSIDVFYADRCVAQATMGLAATTP